MALNHRWYRRLIVWYLTVNLSVYLQVSIYPFISIYPPPLSSDCQLTDQYPWQISEPLVHRDISSDASRKTCVKLANLKHPGIKAIKQLIPFHKIIHNKYSAAFHMDSFFLTLFLPPPLLHPPSLPTPTINTHGNDFFLLHASWSVMKLSKVHCNLQRGIEREVRLVDQNWQCVAGGVLLARW